MPSSAVPILPLLFETFLSLLLLTPSIGCVFLRSNNWQTLSLTDYSTLYPSSILLRPSSTAVGWEKGAVNEKGDTRNETAPTRSNHTELSRCLMPQPPCQDLPWQESMLLARLRRMDRSMRSSSSIRTHSIPPSTTTVSITTPPVEQQTLRMASAAAQALLLTCLCNYQRDTGAWWRVPLRITSAWNK